MSKKTRTYVDYFKYSRNKTHNREGPKNTDEK